MADPFSPGDQVYLGTGQGHGTVVLVNGSYVRLRRNATGQRFTMYARTLKDIQDHREKRGEVITKMCDGTIGLIPRVPITSDQRAQLKRLQACRLGAHHARFIQGMLTETDITELQAEHVARLAHMYRKQLGKLKET